MLVLRKAHVETAELYAAARGVGPDQLCISGVQCRVFSDSPWNAILVPVPALRRSWPTVIDATTTPHLLDDMVAATYGGRLQDGWQPPAPVDRVPVRVLALSQLSPASLMACGGQMANLTPEDIDQVRAMARVYRGWAFLVIVFAGSDAAVSLAPVFYTFRSPKRLRNRLTAPGYSNPAMQLGPDGMPTSTDYTLVASPFMGTRVAYTDDLSSLSGDERSLLPGFVWAINAPATAGVTDGDFVFRVGLQHPNSSSPLVAVRRVQVHPFSRLLPHPR
jgi:hypothetical protein